MKHLLLTTIAAVMLVGCGPSMSISEAAWKGNLEVVKQHLDAGADVDAYGTWHYTALYSAAASSWPEVMKDETAQLEMAQLLIANGADLEARTYNGHTPLHGAIKMGRMEIVELLVANGADVNALVMAEGTEDAWSPLHYAAKGSLNKRRNTAYAPIVKLLIANGADVNAVNRAEKTAMDYVVLTRGQSAGEPPKKKADRVKIQQLLRKHGGQLASDLPKWR